MQLTLRSHVEDWKTLPWKQFQKQVFRLQHRIYKAQQDKNYKLVHKLQRLLFSSRAAKFLSIRQVTQLNEGKVIAGIDRISKLNEKERLELFEDIKSLNNYKHKPLRRVLIPKLNRGEKRPLGVSTIKDRTIQCLIKYLLEPVYEAYASRGSWGFRPGRSTWDVQKHIVMNLNAGNNSYTKRILELDIKKCFDRINHEKILSLIHVPIIIQKILRSALEAGVLNEKDTLCEKTPQVSIISPLLCNIALHGIEDLWNQHSRYLDKRNMRYYTRKSEISQRGLRYAYDTIFFLEGQENADKLQHKIDKFLSERGLNVKELKTRLVKSTGGFDFLGWRFEVRPHGALTCFPSRKNRRSIIDKIKYTMRNNTYTLQERLDKVKVIYTGWRNYHQYCSFRKVNVWSINDWVYQYVKKSNMKIKSRTERAKAKIDRLRTIKDIFNGHKSKLSGYTSVQRDKLVPFR
uniref:putative reverse transcriptase/maturase n=1 Tax=Timspurckia oligopyrenoides TaxID=708627 RepID=UPI001FCD5A97|nr:putative reverse transcriptase/maturase [Timspurckia oligopyrenoides]UNJ17519.1 putative reverse transcriptase/maturase [Timspurckia oligopyrenoides]